MPRIADRLRTLMTPSTSGSTRITKDEITTAAAQSTRAELENLAARSVDAFDSTEALAALSARVGAAAVKAPISSLDSQTASRKWLAGDFEISRGATGEKREALVLLQRALIKIGAHHPEGSTHPALMQLPWGADGDMGDATAAAVNAALKLAGRADLATVTKTSRLGTEIAGIIEELLAATPRVMLPQLVGNTPSPSPSPSPTPGTTTTPTNNGGTGGATSGRLFGAVPIRMGTIPSFEAKWTGVLAKLDAEMPTYRLDNPDITPSERQWLTDLRDMSGRDKMFQLNRVNSVVNSWMYAADNTNWGVADHWASPREFFTRRGDCEDYVITKYASLLKLGFPEESMRLVVVQDRDANNAAHAVLAVDFEGKTYIMDNQNLLVLPEDQVQRRYATGPRYTPLASMNRDNRWIYGNPT